MAIALAYGAYVQYLARHEAEYQYLPLFFVLGIVVPVIGFIYWKVRQKEFTDYDVSNRVKRQQLYRFILPLFGLLALVLIVFRFPIKVILPVLAFFVLLFVSFFINKKLKVSMHTSFCFLFAYLFFPLNASVGITLFAFGFLVAWSRLALRRHSKQEVYLGFGLGNLVGLVYLGFTYLLVLG
jgi:hypothetical protein